ncbi:phage tail sheath subtilisin-like domain-containing protein [Anabaena sp. CCY 9402-a]|uniref:phage tail sheath subtilisin-like domain-containing protein n=1 Tax=Anabaena sp. CCY 9402-a TaxID=3103867 RepID=UPI0039C5D48E
MVNAFSNFLSPGVRLVESSQGYRNLEIASHSTVYMIGSGASGSFNTPTQVTSLADFSNVFGASPSTDEVKLFFRNNRRGILYFVRTQIAQRNEITIASAAAGAYTATINGVAVTYTAPASPTPTLITVADGLLAAINANATVSSAVLATPGSSTSKIYVRAKVPGVTFTLVATTANLTQAVATPSTPVSADYVAAIENSFDADDGWEQGFIIAPEAFKTLTVQSDRLAVGNAMQALASDDAFDWVTLIDPGPDLTPAQAKTEGELYSSPQGHLAFYYPYLIDLETVTVPPSAAVAGVATLRYKEQGFQEPPAGAQYPILGVTDVAFKVNGQIQDTLNPSGINCIRNLRNKGIVIWGMRTRSSDDLYKQVSQRVIMNTINGTLRRGFDNFLFSAIDGFGILLNAMSQTANAALESLWRGKALFGATPVEAFEVKCDFENNTPALLSNGQVIMEVYAVTAPALEKLLINTVKISIGSLPLNQAQTTTTPLG